MRQNTQPFRICKTKIRIVTATLFASCNEIYGTGSNTSEPSQEHDGLATMCFPWHLYVHARRVIQLRLQPHDHGMKKKTDDSPHFRPNTTTTQQPEHQHHHKKKHQQQRPTTITHFKTQVHTPHSDFHHRRQQQTNNKGKQLQKKNAR